MMNDDTEQTIRQETMMRVNKYNVNLSVHQKLGWTAGHVVAVCGDQDKAASLLEMGFNPDKGDKFGWTARQLSEDLHGVDIFQGKTCKESRQVPEFGQGQKWDMTDTHIAAISGKPLHVIECLNKDLESFYKKDIFGYTPLEYLDLLHGDGNFYKHLIKIRRELAELS